MQHHLHPLGPFLPDPSPAKIEGGASSQIHNPFARRTAPDMDAIKAKIISHPQYSSLLEAYMDCQKVGAPSEVVARLTGIARDFAGRQRSALGGGRDLDVSTSDPELDQFMEAYYDMLVKYREELTRPLQEAMDFLRRVEMQLNVLTTGSARVFSPVLCWDGDEDGGEEESWDSFLVTQIRRTAVTIICTFCSTGGGSGSDAGRHF